MPDYSVQISINPTFLFIAASYLSNYFMDLTCGVQLGVT